MATMTTKSKIEARVPADDSPRWPAGTRVVSVVNGKGGVGKTTLAHNLAVYARTVDASLPVLVVGLDGSPGPDAMFALDATSPNETVYTGLRRGSFERAIRPGRYGVYYVPSSPRLAEPIGPAVDPLVLETTLERTGFPGLVILDTGSDMGMLTQSAIAASDLCVVPVSDLASLVAARKVFGLLERLQRPRTRARVVLSMLDLRVKYQTELCSDMLGLLVSAARRLDFPLFQSFVARSPSVQALATNPEGRTFSILNAATRTNAHRQMGELAEEMLEALENARSTRPDERFDTGAAEASLDRCQEPLASLHARSDEAAAALREIREIRESGRNSLDVRQFPFFIGRRDPSVLNDLAIPDRRPWQVSRRHAHLIRREGRIGVMDLGSTLGTWINDRQLGGPTADPGPVFFGEQDALLTLGRRRSPYVFELRVGRAAAPRPLPEETAAPPVRAIALAALVH